MHRRGAPEAGGWRSGPAVLEWVVEHGDKEDSPPRADQRCQRGGVALAQLGVDRHEAPAVERRVERAWRRGGVAVAG